MKELCSRGFIFVCPMERVKQCVCSSEGKLEAKRYEIE